MTGLELSPEMLRVAQRKSVGNSNIRWVQGNMKEFEIGRRFGLVLIPGHSFQFMLTPDDQVKCLETIRRHLSKAGELVIHLDHQDLSWLGELPTKHASTWDTGCELAHPETGQRIIPSYAWAYEPHTQTATVRRKWEAVGQDGSVLERWELEPMRLHCVFRFEMEHLLLRTGHSVEAVYGDFFKNSLTSESAEMIWVMRKEGE